MVNKKSSSRKTASRKSSSRKSSSNKSLLKSKLVLNLSYTLFVLNILAFLFFKDIQNLCLLLIGSCITYLFNKNLIIVLTVPMIFVATLIFLKGNSVNENFKGGKKKDSKKGSKKGGEKENEKENEGENQEENQEENEGEKVPTTIVNENNDNQIPIEESGIEQGEKPKTSSDTGEKPETSSGTGEKPKTSSGTGGKKEALEELKQALEQLNNLSE